ISAPAPAVAPWSVRSPAAVPEAARLLDVPPRFHAATMLPWEMRVPHAVVASARADARPTRARRWWGRRRPSATAGLVRCIGNIDNPPPQRGLVPGRPLVVRRPHAATCLTDRHILHP